MKIERIETEVEIDEKTNEIHMSQRTACSCGWDLAQVTMETTRNAFQDQNGVRVPYTMSLCCSAKLHAATIAALLELSVRDQMSRFPGVDRDTVTAAMLRMVRESHAIVRAQNPEHPNPIGVA